MAGGKTDVKNDESKKKKKEGGNPEAKVDENGEVKLSKKEQNKLKKKEQKANAKAGKNDDEATGEEPKKEAKKESSAPKITLPTAEMDKFEKNLAKKQFLGGDKPGQGDLDLYDLLQPVVAGLSGAAVTHPNVFAHFCLLSKFSD